MPVIPSPSDLKIIRLYICLGTWVTVVEREKNKAIEYGETNYVTSFYTVILTMSG